MHTLDAAEEKALLGKGPTLHLRRVAPADAASVHAVIRSSMQQSQNNTSLDAAPTLDRIKSLINASRDFPNVLYDVAVDAASGTVFGFVNLVPYVAQPPGQRSCFAQTSSLQVTTAGDKVLGKELNLQVKSALINRAVAASRSGSTGARTLVVDMLVTREQGLNPAAYQVFLDAGFKVVGRVEEVAEKGCVLLDQLFLQCKVHDSGEKDGEKQQV